MYASISTIFVPNQFLSFSFLHSKELKKWCEKVRENRRSLIIIILNKVLIYRRIQEDSTNFDKLSYEEKRCLLHLVAPHRKQLQRNKGSLSKETMEEND